jgi:hypothetical protein
MRPESTRATFESKKIFASIDPSLSPFSVAWRIDEQVIRGEIDNRTRGRVTGRIWFAGRDDPVTLDLEGDAWRDLAGRRLEFVNPEPKPGLADSFASLQQGVVGDMTASRKVRVPEISMEEFAEYFAQRRPFPWHWGNCLYLEWFSGRNGRVVIESPYFRLTVAADETAWEMSEAEEHEQRLANTAALTTFMERLVGSTDQAARNEELEESDESEEDDEFGRERE